MSKGYAFLLILILWNSLRDGTIAVMYDKWVVSQKPSTLNIDNITIYYIDT